MSSKRHVETAASSSEDDATDTDASNFPKKARTSSAPHPTPAVLSYVDSLFGLNGRVCVVFGGTGVLCGAIACGYYDAGATVVIVGRSETKATAVRGDRDSERFHFIAADASLPETPAAVRDQVMERYGKVDVLVNGVGVNSATPFADIDGAEMVDIFDKNFFFAARCCQAFVPALTETGGSIINVGSITGVSPLSKVFMYGSSKAALSNLSQNLIRSKTARFSQRSARRASWITRPPNVSVSHGNSYPSASSSPHARPRRLSTALRLSSTEASQRRRYDTSATKSPSPDSLPCPNTGIINKHLDTFKKK